ncbi:sensor histidine kinase [Sediminicola arcticus]|jgi:two-component sensor histidine kinase|uniref:histidine kinase n=1 Tax=Sediminicola arcticus TaxID=1574308 RepID=A0ABV2SQR4_9FLAO
MERAILKLIMTLLLSFVNNTISYGQIFDFDREPPYNQIFVDTDNFGISYLDELEEGLSSITNDTIKLKVINDLAYYWHTRNLNTALEFSKKGILLAERLGNTQWEGRLLVTQGAILLRMENLNVAEQQLEAAKTKVIKEDLPFLNTQLGYVFERRGDLGKAADYAMETLRLGEALNDKWAQAQGYSDLSNLFWKQSKFKIGLKNGLTSVNLFKERGITDLDYGFALYVVGNNYLGLEDYTSALKYYEQSIVIGQRYGFYNNLADVYISLIDLYSFLGKFNKGEQATSSAIKYSQLLDNQFLLMRSWLSQGKLQNLQGKYISAIESLEQCLSIATDEFGDVFYLSQAYEALGKAHAGNHNYQEAYSAFEEYDKLEKEIFTAEADQRISLLQTQFEVAQKENTIQLQETKLKQQNTRQVFMVITIALSMMFLGFGYMAIKANRKKNKKLQEQNKEKEYLIKEVHHRVKNNLEIVSSLLALQASHLENSKLTFSLQEIQNRVYSMSMIHQRLYQDRNIAAIDMGDYFSDLGTHVLESFGAEERININYKIQNISLDMDTAVPIGLIVNELLTNSFKYAFPNNMNGTIGLFMQLENTRLIVLQVADNGVGQSKEEHEKTKGFGKQLIDLLVQQLGGKLTYEHTNNGTKAILKFSRIQP